MPYRYPRTPQHNFTVRRSNAGLGLFAKSKIAKGDFVIEYFGPLLDDAASHAKGGKYLFAVDDDLTIDGSGRQNLARYLNHSCRPNCEAEHDGKRIFIYALKNIKPGEELTYHYGKEYFEDFIKPLGCRCGQH
jgi:SET domain-containing protein